MPPPKEKVRSTWMSILVPVAAFGALIVVARIVGQNDRATKEGQEEATKAATVVPVVEAPLVLPPLAPAGDARTPRFSFQLAVYQAGAAPPAAVRKLAKQLEQAGLVASSEGRPTAVEDASFRISSVPAPPGFPLEAGFGRFGKPPPSDAEREAFRRSAFLTTVAFEGPGARGTAVYRAASEALRAFEAEAPGFLWDQASGNAFTRTSWARRGAAWTGDVPDVAQHIMVEESKDGQHVRLATRGMRRFGLPDLAVSQVSARSRDPFAKVVNMVAQSLVENSVLGPEGRLRVEPARSKNAAARARWEQGRFPGAGPVSLALATATPREGEARNAFLEIVFPGAASTLSVRQQAALNTLLGSRDETSEVRVDSPAMRAAEARARAGLLALKPRFKAGLPRGAWLLVKAVFRAGQASERMWIAVDAWEGSRLSGQLSNAPTVIPNLQAGARVEVQEADVIDYLLTKPDGTEEGNWTLNVPATSAGAGATEAR